MLVMSPELFDRQVIRNRISSLEKDMYEILNKRGLTDAQKWNHFRRSLDRYLAVVADAKKPINIPIIKNITTGIRETDPNPKFEPSFGVPSFHEFKGKLERSPESRKSVNNFPRLKDLASKAETPKLEWSEGVSAALSDFHRENREADRKWGEMMERLDRAETLANSVHVKTSTPVKPTRLKKNQNPERSTEKIGKSAKTKRYKPNYTTEVFIIESILRGNRVPTYKLTDLNGEPITGSFYESELSKTIVSEQTEFKINKIVKRRGKGSSLQYFVKWVGYPDSFNSWVKASDVKQLR
ncbi:hypothetical protein J437_LFUL016613 [Ladona fulva]|uniref:Chromo domain-containing protein n=1 Tax=Ladona fulva TaxID=123851 RepID=A0A8K0PCU8_LADFU|nr:hypothetical protein J437_LFUL016613 [Ladona fulva]